MRRHGSHFVEAAGVRLHARVEGDGAPVVLLHGFTGSTETLEGVAAGLRDRHRVVRLDLVGHGESEAPDDPGAYTLHSCVAQVAAALDALGIPRTHALGYSMGGRVALALCAWRPERVRSALLVGASAGIEDPAARAARRRDDEALAAALERDGIEAFVERWMGQPLFATQSRLGEAALARARAQRLANRPRALALSLRGMGAGAQPPLHALLPGIRTRIGLAVGELDAKFRAIGAELAARLGDARLLLVPGAGHACHLEQPGHFLRLARGFLAEARPGASIHPLPGVPT